MSFADVVNKIIMYIGFTVPVIVGFAVVVFLYGMLGYMMNLGDESKRKESIRYMISGLVGFFVMVSVWGLVSVLTTTFGFTFGIPRIL